MARRPSWSWTPQSQRSEPRASPVRHSECTLVTTSSPPSRSPLTSARYTDPDAHSKANAWKIPADVGRGTLTSRRGGSPATFPASRGTRSRIGGVAPDDEGGDRAARAVVVGAPRQVAVVPVEVPRPAEGEVLVRTLWSGISAGTEMLAYRGEIDPALALDDTIGALGGSFTFPFRYGYSCVGRAERPGHGLPDG